MNMAGNMWPKIRYSIEQYIKGGNTSGTRHEKYLLFTFKFSLEVNRSRDLSYATSDTMTSLLLLSLLLTSHVLALPSVTSLRVSPGSCQSYPNSFHGAGDNADAFLFTPDQADNSTINGLKTGIYGTNLVVYPNTPDATSTIFCCDRGGTVLDGFGVQPLLLSMDSSDEELGYLTQGLGPETYVHVVNGTKLDGIFLGKGNVTTFGFRYVTSPASFWQVRLLGSGKNLKDGEFMGFLKVVSPGSP
jgi:hypothetical protein